MLSSWHSWPDWYRDIDDLDGPDDEDSAGVTSSKEIIALAGWIPLMDFDETPCNRSGSGSTIDRRNFRVGQTTTVL